MFYVQVQKEMLRPPVTFYEGGGPFSRVLSAYLTSRNKRPPIQNTNWKIFRVKSLKLEHRKRSTSSPTPARPVIFVTFL